MHDESNRIGSFLAGAFIGAGLALLLAPRSGKEIRNFIRDYAGRAVDEINERLPEMKETLDSTFKKGQEAYEGVKEQGQEALKKGKETLRHVSETAKKAG